LYIIVGRKGESKIYVKTKCENLVKFDPHSFFSKVEACVEKTYDFCTRLSNALVSDGILAYVAAFGWLLFQL